VKNKWIIGIVLVLLSCVSYAECGNHICQNIAVDKLYPNTNGVVYVATSGDEKNLNCSAESGAYLTFNLSDPAGDAYYSTLLAAQMSNRNVSIRIVLGSVGCNVQYMTIDKQ